MGGRAGRGERKAGEGVLDVSIRPGAVRLSTGKVVTVGFARGEKGDRERGSLFLLLFLFLFPLPPGRYERNFFFGAGARGSETLRGLFSNPSRLLYFPLFVPEHTRESSLVFPRGVIFFRMPATL